MRFNLGPFMVIELIIYGILALFFMMLFESE